jgi:hypothetical protein
MLQLVMFMEQLLPQKIPPSLLADEFFAIVQLLSVTEAELSEQHTPAPLRPAEFSEIMQSVMVTDAPRKEYKPPP